MKSSESFLRKEVIAVLKDFLRESKTFQGPCFKGCYTMESRIFFDALEEYLKSGNNYLDEYTEIMNLPQTFVCYDQFKHCDIRKSLTLPELQQKEDLLNNKGFWNVYDLYSEEDVDSFKREIAISRAEIFAKQKELESSDYRNTPEYKVWRAAVFERDDFTCLECDQKGGRLEAHHIKSFKKYPKLRYEIDNGMTLCCSYHQARHKKNA